MATLTEAAPRHLQRYLLESERLVVAVRRHPARLLEPVLSAVGGLVLVGWLDTYVVDGLPVVPDVLWLAWVAVVLRAIWRLAEWRQDWFVATDQRLILTYGLVTRKVAMMPLSKVTDLSYSRSPLGRLLGYGEFVLESAGHDQAMRAVAWLPSPDVLYRRICTEIFDPRHLPRTAHHRGLAGRLPAPVPREEGTREQVTAPVPGWDAQEPPPVDPEVMSDGTERPVPRWRRQAKP